MVDIGIGIGIGIVTGTGTVLILVHDRSIEGKMWRNLFALFQKYTGSIEALSIDWLSFRCY